MKPWQLKLSDISNQKAGKNSKQHSGPLGTISHEQQTGENSLPELLSEQFFFGNREGQANAVTASL